MNRKVITSGDVARLAEVSQSAVSRAFTPGASIAPDTRDKILKAAAKLGYRPNALARAMISGRSKLIALLVAYMDNQYIPLLVDRITRRLQVEGYSVLLFISDPGPQDELVKRIMQYQVDGILMASSILSSNLALECEQSGIPVVLMNRFQSTSPASSVTADNIEGGRLVAELFAGSGHKRMAFIAGDEDSSTNRDREEGFYREIAARGAAVWARRVGYFEAKRARQAALELFSKDEYPDAVFVANDHMALAVVDVLRRDLNLRVPEDVSVVGFDDVPEASLAAYELTTVEHSISQLVEATLEILFAQIDNQEVTKTTVILPVKLIVRATAKLPSPSVSG